MAERIMYIQIKTGFDTDGGFAWMCRLRFSKSWKAACFRVLAQRRVLGIFGSNFVAPETGDEYWVSGLKRNLRDSRYSNVRPLVDVSVVQDYEAYLAGAPLPGRENGCAAATILVGFPLEQRAPIVMALGGSIFSVENQKRSDADIRGSFA